MRLTALVIVLAMAFGFTPATAQDDIDEAREMRDRTREEELLAEAELELLDAEFVDVQAALDAADELVALQTERVASARAHLDAATTHLRQTETAIAWAEFDIDALDAAMTEVAVDRYLGDGDDRSSDILGADDLNSGVARTALLDVVANRSADVIDVARAAEARYEDLTTEAEEAVEEVSALEAELENELVYLEEAQAVRQAARDALENRRQEWRDRIAELDAEEDELSQFIANEQARLDGRTPVISATSQQGYIWPTAGALGSVFGNRLHPILGYYRMHSGLDIGGAQGANIWAAKEGTVIMAGWNGGYGNTIVIDHGGGLSTLYAHQSDFAVSVGDYVETGQLIGYIGSTGMSTGPHLHFEVRASGAPIDPLPFLPAR